MERQPRATAPNERETVESIGSGTNFPTWVRLLQISGEKFRRDSADINVYLVAEV
jgi:hypothetical protein